MAIIPFNKETGQYIDNRRKSDRIRENHPNAKLTQLQVDEIRKLASEGVSTMALASRFGVGKTAVNDIIRYRTWKSLKPQIPEK